MSGGPPPLAPGGAPAAGPAAGPGGPVSLDALRDTLAHELAGLPPGDIDDPIAFFTAVAEYLLGWLASSSGDARGAPAAFVFVERPRLEGERLGMTRLPLFRYGYEHPVRGGVFVSGAGLADVFSATPVETGLAGLARHLEQAGLAGRPTAVLLSDGSDLALFPRGVADEADGPRIRLGAAAAPRLDAAAVEAFLNAFYTEYVRVPQPGHKMWEHAEHHVPVRRAERSLQEIMYVPARAHFRNHAVRQEDSNREGIADISIMHKGDLRALGTGVIELKVLKSRRHAAEWRDAGEVSASDNQDAVRDGIDQARCYRDELVCDFTVLACFDMRVTDEGDSIFDAVRADADALGVRCRRFYMYNSPEAGRRGRAGSVGRVVTKRAATKRAATKRAATKQPTAKQAAAKRTTAKRAVAEPAPRGGAGQPVRGRSQGGGPPGGSGTDAPAPDGTAPATSD